MIKTLLLKIGFWKKVIDLDKPKNRTYRLNKGLEVVTEFMDNVLRVWIRNRRGK